MSRKYKQLKGIQQYWYVKYSEENPIKCLEVIRTGAKPQRVVVADYQFH
jgi:hypothetical protein